MESTLCLSPGPHRDEGSLDLCPQQLVLAHCPVGFVPTSLALGHLHRPSSSWPGSQELLLTCLFSPLPFLLSLASYTSNLLPGPFHLERKCLLHALLAGSESTGVDEGKASGCDFHI